MMKTATATEPAPPAATAATAVLLPLLWLASPALPVGGFSYSDGLESAVEQGLVHDEASAAAWLRSQTTLALARADLPLLAQAHAAWGAHDLARITALNDWQRMTRETQELRQQTEQMGRSLVEWLRNQRRADDDARLAHLAALAPSPTWPVAFGLATARSGASVEQALACAAFGWAENGVQAALKAVPLGQLAGQRILQQLVDALPALIGRAAGCSDAERQSFTPMLAIQSARHETQYSRLFRS